LQISFGIETRRKSKQIIDIEYMGKILVRHGEKMELAKLFGVSTVTVRSALNEVTQSELSKRIRKAAIQRGGAEVKSQER
jgi:DeoR/GlpR family transcriptional regulator of sugar metabolism